MKPLSSIMDFAGLDAPEPETLAPRHITREAWLNAFVELATPHFATVGLTMPDKIRVSIGWPSSGMRSKTIGECWTRAASGDAHAEIFVSPALKEPERIAGVLTHELIHAVVGHDAKHGPQFRKPAVALGLEGKMTATTEGDKWREWALPLLAELGPYPGNQILGVLAGGKKKQGTRMLKLECNECGIVLRTTKTHLQAIADAYQAEADEEAGEDMAPVAPHARCINPACNGHMPFDLNADDGEGE